MVTRQPVHSPAGSHAITLILPKFLPRKNGHSPAGSHAKMHTLPKFWPLNDGHSTAGSHAITLILSIFWPHKNGHSPACSLASRFTLKNAHFTQILASQDWSFFSRLTRQLVCTRECTFYLNFGLVRMVILQPVHSPADSHAKMLNFGLAMMLIL